MPLLIGCLVGMIAAFLIGKAAHRFLPQHGKWAINPNPVSCPGCGAPLPRARRPQNRRQALWGGWTCQHCGVECDKFGAQVGDPPSNDPD